MSRLICAVIASVVMIASFGECAYARNLITAPGFESFTVGTTKTACDKSTITLHGIVKDNAPLKLHAYSLDLHYNLFAPGFTPSQIKTATYTLSESVTNIGDVKSIANNTHVAFSGIVTGAFADGMVFVENENRTCG
ncbi:MAG: hypothetical protein ABFD54_03275, partial [Armatimonadota bacterium]